MLASAYFDPPRHPLLRYRALGIVVLLHLALGWLLVQGTSHQSRLPMPQPLQPVLLQEVMIGAPATAPQPAPAPAAALQLQSRPRAPVQPPEPVTRQPATPAPVLPSTAPRPDSTPRSAEPRVDRRPATRVPPPAPVPTPAPALVPAEAPADPLPAPARPVKAAASAAAPGVTAPPAAMASTEPPAVAGTAASGLARTPAPGRTPAAGAAASAASQTAAPSDIALVCPVQVAPLMPRLAVRGGINGEVTAQAVIVDGVVREVRILSGPPIFHNAVRSAMRQYRCESKPSEVVAMQTFVFKFE